MMKQEWLTTDGLSTKDIFPIEKYEQHPVRMDETGVNYYTKMPSYSLLYSSTGQGNLSDTKRQQLDVNNPTKKNSVQHTPSKILYNVLCYMDGTLMLMKKEQQYEMVVKFKHDMAKNLDNELQLYRVMGFHKKKKITINGFKDRILASNFDETTDEFTWTYIARLLGRKVIVTSLQNKTCDTYGDGTGTVVYILDSHKLFDVEQNTDIFCHENFKGLLPSADTVINMSLSELNAWVKFFEIKECKTKVAKSATLAAKLASYQSRR